MAKPISQMAADLEDVTAGHMKDSLKAVDETADLMAKRAQSLSSPVYGVAVSARVVGVPGGARVEVATRSTDGPGRVFGGQSAVDAQVARVIDSTAKEGGLDRRR